MMSGKNRVAYVVKVKTATLTLISLTMKLSLILTPRIGLRSNHTLDSLPPESIAFGVRFRSIWHRQSGWQG